jgi:hypothetical protein
MIADILCDVARPGHDRPTITLSYLPLARFSRI